MGRQSLQGRQEILQQHPAMNSSSDLRTELSSSHRHDLGSNPGGDSQTE